VDFVLRKGELRCVIGPNGAGKTTFFRCLTGSQRLSSGRILFRDWDISGAERFRIARAGIGIKTQIPNLFEGQTAHENVWAALREIKSARARDEAAMAALERVGVAHLAPRVVGRMAHGERQLVELAMVIARDPELILLDEPAAGMTNDEVARLAEIVASVNQRHSVIVIEHDMQFIRMIGRLVTVFHQGRVLIEDGVSEILANPIVRDIYLGRSHAA
ncbi:MAG TPA: ATP-binding cassette domain-containing protein, partial [Roseiarcus sp.]|nr:ATP-binding cassette domain-containing protein [Roseiarcus sp.]